MGSQQVDADIYSNQRHVDGPLRRPVRLLPDGRAGVVYAGEVYPLYAGNRVDLDDSAYDKYECMQFVPDSQVIPYAAPPVANRPSPALGQSLLSESAWSLETNRFGHYLVFDADETTAERVVDRIDATVLGVRRWDASHRPAADGRFYGWFIRLSFDGDRDECLRLVRSIVGGGEAAPSAGMQLEGVPEHLRAAVLAALQKALAVARENTDLHAEVEQLRLQLSRSASTAERTQAALADQVSALEATVLAKQDELQAERRSDERRKAKLQERIEQLQASHQQQVALWRAQLAETASAQAGTESDELVALRGQVIAGASEIDSLQAEVEQMWDTEKHLNERLTEARAQVLALTAEVEAARQGLERRETRLAEVENEERERTTAQAHRTAGKRRPDLQTFLDKMLRRCDLDEASIEELFKFERTDKVIHELMRIDRDDPQLAAVSKKVQGYGDWWELPKINTGASGKSAKGRIYYRSYVGGVEAVVHLKKDDDEQRRFMAKRLT